VNAKKNKINATSTTINETYQPVYDSDDDLFSMHAS